MREENCQQGDNSGGAVPVVDKPERSAEPDDSCSAITSGIVSHASIGAKTGSGAWTLPAGASTKPSAAS